MQNVTTPAAQSNAIARASKNKWELVDFVNNGVAVLQAQNAPSRFFYVHPNGEGYNSLEGLDGASEGPVRPYWFQCYPVAARNVSPRHRHVYSRIVWARTSKAAQAELEAAGYIVDTGVTNAYAVSEHVARVCFPNIWVNSPAAQAA